jgi:hypothetical protein
MEMEMYTMKKSGNDLEFWFVDYDDWLNIKDQVEDAYCFEPLPCHVFSYDYMGDAIDNQRYCDEVQLPMWGRCCIFMLNVPNVNAAIAIVHSEYNEWKYISENDPNYAK